MITWLYITDINIINTFALNVIFFNCILDLISLVNMLPRFMCYNRAYSLDR